MSVDTPGVLSLEGDHAMVFDVTTTHVAERRIYELRNRIVRLAEQGAVDLAVIEDFAFGRAQKAHEMGGFSYAVRLALRERGIETVIAPIGAAKKFISGAGNANKLQMGVAVFKRWGFEHRSDDVIDAYSLARCGQVWLESRDDTVRTRRVSDLVKGMRLVERLVA